MRPPRFENFGDMIYSQSVPRFAHPPSKNMKKIGKIVQLQIQQDPLKSQVTGGRVVYDPAGIMVLQEIRLTTFGIVGIMDFLNREMAYLDVHHLRHPQSRFRGDNKISIGFTGHYQRMRHEFGKHLRDGLAGENIIIQADDRLAPQDLGRRLAIRSRQHDSLILLCEIKPIPPCEPFTRFARKAPALSPSETKRDLQFLSGGLRGYYLEVESAPEEAILQIGDTVYRVD